MLDSMSISSTSYSKTCANLRSYSLVRWSSVVAISVKHFPWLLVPLLGTLSTNQFAPLSFGPLSLCWSLRRTCGWRIQTRLPRERPTFALLRDISSALVMEPTLSMILYSSLTYAMAGWMEMSEPILLIQFTVIFQTLSLFGRPPTSPKERSWLQSTQTLLRSTRRFWNSTGNR